MALRLSLVSVVLTYAFAVVAVLTNTTHHGTKRACSGVLDIAVVRSVPTWISLPGTRIYPLDLSRSQRNYRPPLIPTAPLDIIEGT